MLLWSTSANLVLASPFHVGRPLYLRAPILAIRLARQRREHSVAGTITPIYCCEGSVPIQESCSTYRACPARACWGQDNRSVAHFAEYFLEGREPSGSVQEAIVKFVATRQVTGHPIVVTRGERGSDEDDDDDDDEDSEDDNQ